MKAIKKTVQIIIAYHDVLELKTAMALIEDQILDVKTNHNTGRIGDVHFHWSLQYDGFQEYREEQIDGVWYCIYKSKMK